MPNQETRRTTLDKKSLQKEAFVITNPRSQKSKKMQTRLKKVLDAFEIKTYEILTSEPYHASRIIAEIAKEPRPIFVISGDGTLFEITNGLAAVEDKHPDMHIVPVPGGGANDFATSLMPRGLKSLQKALAQKTQADKIDTLEMEITYPDGSKDRRYANGYLGFGVTAKGSDIINKRRPKNRFSELKALRGVVSAPFTVLVDGNREKLISLTFHNIKRMARYIRIKNADPFDGYFEVLAIRPSRILNAILKSAILGTKGLRKESVEISFPDDPVWCQADGEVFPQFPKGTKVKIGIKHRHLPVLSHKR